MRKYFSFLKHVRRALSQQHTSLLYTFSAEVLSWPKYLFSRAINPRRCRIRNESNRGLVTKLYAEILLREPDCEGLARHVRFLNMGRITPQQLEESMRNSTEFRELVRPISDEVQFVYERIRFRKPTLAELTQHAASLRSRSSSLSDLVQILHSQHRRSSLALRPLVVEMDITNQCNLRCVFCYFSDEKMYRQKRQDLSLEDFSRIAEQLFPFCGKVGLSVGTEPLLHHEFKEMLAMLPKYGIPHTFITTNGLLLREEIVSEMIRTNFSRVNISMDAATKQTYERIRVGSNFDKLISNIRAFNRIKEKAGATTPSLCLVFVLMRSNIRELPAFIRLARELKAGAVTAIHMVPYTFLNDTHESLSLEKGLCNQMLDEARSLARDYGISFVGPANFPEVPNRIGQILPAPAAETPEMSVPEKDHVSRFDFGLIDREAQTSCCPFPWHFLGIDSSGNVNPCGWWYTEKPMGNIKTQTFEEIWNSAPYRTLRSELRTRNLRKTCQLCPAAGMGRVQEENAFRIREL